MELTGSVPSEADKEVFWAALLNAQYWKEAIPDAEKFEMVGENLYELVVNVDIGPIKGNQTVMLQFSDLQPPDSGNFELQNQLIKSAKGTLELKDPSEVVVEDGAAPLPASTVSVLEYKMELDAGNPFFNAMLEGFKGKIKEGFEELVGRLEARTRNQEVIE